MSTTELRLPDEHAQRALTLAVPTGRACCPGCAAVIEARLRANPHVRAVHVEAPQQVAYVEVDEASVPLAELTELVGRACGSGCPTPLPDASVSSHAHAHTAAPAPQAQAVEHSAHADMSDPRMAAAMEADMRRRFWISLVLALPVLAYSSLGMLLLGGRALPTPPGVPADWIMLRSPRLWRCGPAVCSTSAPTTR